MEIHEGRHELVCKLVYAGPALAGKTANLERLFLRTPEARRGKLSHVGCASGRAEFEATEFRLGEMGGHSVRLRVYTLPSAEACKTTHAHLLKDVDGVLFVADSDPQRLVQNVEALTCLEESLREQGRELADLPLVFQWNKRDVPNATPVRRLSTMLNRWSRPAIEAVVPEGFGVLSSFKLLTEQALVDVTRKLAPFVDADLAAQAARTCSSRLSAQAAPVPDTRRFPRPKTGRLARPKAQAPAVDAEPTPQVEQPSPARHAGSPYKVVGSRRLRRGRRSSRLVAALVVATAAAVGGLLGSQDAFHSLGSAIATSVSDK